MSHTAITSTADTGDLSLSSAQVGASRETLGGRRARHFVRVEPKSLPACLPLSSRQSPRRWFGSGVPPIHSPDPRGAQDEHVLNGRTFIAGRSRGDFSQFVTRANTYAVTRGACTPSRVGALYSRMQIFSYASTAHRCAPVEADMFPGRLRSHKARDRTPRATAATKAYESCEMTAPVPTPRNPRITRSPERNRRFPASTPTDLATTRKSI